METSSKAYLQHLRSLPYDDYFRNGNVPLGYERGEGTDCRCGHATQYYPDILYCVCDVR
jgi:hypothetical protein